GTGFFGKRKNLPSPRKKIILSEKEGVFIHKVVVVSCPKVNKKARPSGNAPRNIKHPLFFSGVLANFPPKEWTPRLLTHFHRSRATARARPGEASTTKARSEKVWRATCGKRIGKASNEEAKIANRPEPTQTGSIK